MSITTIWVDVAIWGVYWIVGHLLTSRAYEHLRERNKVRPYPLIFSRSKFRPEGERLRRRAARYWVVGGVTLLVAYVWWLRHPL